MSRGADVVADREADQLQRGTQDQGQLRLRDRPSRIPPDPDRLPRADDPAGRRLEEELRAAGRVDQIVEGGGALRLFLPGHLAAFVGHAGPPDFLGIQGRQDLDRRDRQRSTVLSGPLADLGFRIVRVKESTQAAGTRGQRPDLVALEQAHAGRRDVGQVGSRELDEPHELAPRGWIRVGRAGGDPLPL